MNYCRRLARGYLTAPKHS
jgi:hypothetical protein